MKRRPVRVLALVAMVLGMLGAVNQAAAANSVTSGWWTSATFLPAPDVDDGQLLVQSGPTPDQPLAYAGISFVLAQDEIPELLTLDVAGESASSPASALRLCRLDGTATAAAGESAEDAPAPDCTTEVEGVASEDGTSFDFDVTAFPAEGSLDVAVVPGGQSDRIVLEAPSVLSLSSEIPFDFDGGGQDTAAPPSPPATGGSSGSSSSSGGSAGAPSPSFSPPAPSQSSSFSAGSGSVTADSPVGTPAPAPADDPAEERAAAPTEPPAPFEAVPAASQGGAGDSGGLFAPLLFVLLAATAGILWSMAGNTRDELAPQDPAPAA